jgi:DNA mismatch repair protein MLH1
MQVKNDKANGQKADLPILAERFTTSKLSKISDLSHLMTYEFRGEALASISHVAHLSVVTKAKKDTLEVGW